MSSALDLALRWLKSRDYLEQELRDKLAQRGYDDLEIATTLERLRALRVVHDERTTQILAEQAVSKRKRGRQSATNDLIRRGIEPDQAEKLVQDRLSSEEEKERGRKLLTDREDRLHSAAQAGRFLAARGFDEDIITDLLEERFET